MSEEETRYADRRRREGRIWRIGFALSVLFHIVVFLLWRSDGPVISPFAAAGPKAGGEMAAGGSRVVQLRSQQPTPIVPPPEPIETPEVTEIEPVDLEPRMEMASVVGDRPGDAEGPGLPDATGEGAGGDAERGRFRKIPPSPRGMIIPPTDRQHRGKEIQVWVFVDETGQVVPDSTRLQPPTGDASFDRRLKREAAEWIFDPAKKGGEPVGSWFPYTITL